ncbi:MAG: MoaD/ThiS family protein [Actinomycetota bacterium]|nr:MoaD/ThiS family protein [Actinomycetota bacterium]
MVVIALPALLAAEAGGQGRFELKAATVEEALRALPVSDRLFDERGSLRRLVNVYVDGVDVRERGGLESELDGHEEIRLVGAIAGG